MKTAKLFKTGRSVAVRIPKAWVQNTEEVTLENKGEVIIMRRKLPSLGEAAAECAAIGGGFPDRLEGGASGVRVRLP